MKPVLSTQERQLAKHCFWDAEAQTLWVDCRRWMPKHGVFSIPGWDAMMMGSEPIPDYPQTLSVLEWSDYSQLSFWKKQIPAWVLESCALFPTHQLHLLHYVGRYPQLLELLDHSPMLAWRLVASKLTEADIVALLQDKRTQVVEQLGWPGKKETVHFLRKLRLRYVTAEISEFVETCILDEERLSALQALPRVNSMALSLAARFPQLIGSRLHVTLAQLPCRPMQCQSMIAQLEDTFRLAAFLQLSATEIAKIGQCRYLVDVEKIYQAWWPSEVMESDTLNLSEQPVQLTEYASWLALSRFQKHYWLTDWSDFQAGKVSLWAAERDGVPVTILREEAVSLDAGEMAKIRRIRQSENQLPSSQQLSFWHLWLVGKESPRES